MAVRTKPIPSLRRHVDGRYTARLSGRDYYFGRHRAVAEQQYHGLVAYWLAGGRQLPAAVRPEVDEGVLVGELVLGFITWARGYYVGDDGQVTGQYDKARAAVKPLVELFSTKPASQFSPVDLRAVRAHMLVHRTWCRKTVNAYCSIIKRLFRWGVEHGHVPSTVWQGLLSVSEIPAGRCGAADRPPTPPVADAIVEATLPHLPPVVADMVRVQRLTGMRPGEICIMRGVDIDTRGDVWLYRPRHHKLKHRGKQRVVQLGPRAQAIIVARMRMRSEAHIFAPGKRGGEHYTAASYRRAITRATKRAGVEDWAPNRLRHAAASELHREYGWDVAGAVLGHSKPSTTAVYVDRDQRVAAEAVRRLG